MTKPERTKLAVLVAVLVGIAAYAFWPGDDAPAVSARRAAVPAGRVIQRGATGVTPEQVPTLGPLVPSLVGQGVPERDIFGFYTPPTRVPTVPPPTPTPIPGLGSAQFIGPALPTPTPTATPIIPPPIPYKLMGLFGSSEHPIAAFEDNGRLINAREGDVLDGRFIVRKVNKESVDFAFVGLPSEITRRLAMTTTEAAR